MEITKINIISRDPEQMKIHLRYAALRLAKSKDNFSIKASMEQHHIFKEEFGISMRKYVVDAIKPQKPIHTRRSLT